jgi:hypothetical protein
MMGFGAVYLANQSTAVLVIGFHAHHSPLGIALSGVTAGVCSLWRQAKTERMRFGQCSQSIAVGRRHIWGPLPNCGRGMT